MLIGELDFRTGKLQCDPEHPYETYSGGRFLLRAGIDHSSEQQGTSPGMGQEYERG